MDTTGYYVAMCDNPGLQSLWVPVEGDWVMTDKGIHALGTMMFGIPKKVEDWERPYWRLAVMPESSAWKRRETSDGLVMEIREGGVIQHLSHCIWLPRQDQLQWMADVMSPSQIRTFLWKWTPTKYFTEKFTTFEQMWLGYYMKVKNKLLWNGQRWARDKEK